MKKIILALMLLVSIPAMAQHHGHGFRHHGHHGYYYGGGVNRNWVAPLIIGGVVTYALTRPAPQPVIVEQQPTVIQTQISTCTEWKEIHSSDGRVYKERTCYQR
jgi:hypothetical protein